MELVRAATKYSRLRRLIALVGVVVVLLLVKVYCEILLQYRWYFPADFDRSAFLSGRRDTFFGTYRVAFYVHIVSGPICLAFGTWLMCSGRLSIYPRLHRWIGKLQLAMVLLVLAPSGIVLANQAYTGPVAAAGFTVLALATGASAARAGYLASQRRFVEHRQWATRCFVLLLSPLLLRLVSGAVMVLGLESELSYQLNSWLSWLVPLIGYEMFARYRRLLESACRVPRAHWKWETVQ